MIQNYKGLMSLILLANEMNIVLHMPLEKMQSLVGLIGDRTT